MELHGWEDKLSTFIQMTKEGKWKEMGDLVTEEMMDEYAVVGTIDELPG